MSDDGQSADDSRVQYDPYDFDTDASLDGDDGDAHSLGGLSSYEDCIDEGDVVAEAGPRANRENNRAPPTRGRRRDARRDRNTDIVDEDITVRHGATEPLGAREDRSAPNDYDLTAPRRYEYTSPIGRSERDKRARRAQAAVSGETRNSRSAARNGDVTGSQAYGPRAPDHDGERYEENGAALHARPAPQRRTMTQRDLYPDERMYVRNEITPIRHRRDERYG